jgi:NADH-quinone oxidoreductase subunit I
MTNEFEMADHSRDKLIYEKSDLLGPLLPGMVAAPHPLVEGTTETDYYAGNIAGATPEQAAWVADPADPSILAKGEGAKTA